MDITTKYCLLGKYQNLDLLALKAYFGDMLFKTQIFAKTWSPQRSANDYRRNLVALLIQAGPLDSANHIK